jgi:V8-like Glu-specific endopeptidase
MLRITVLSGARSGARFDVAKPVVRVGRAPDNDVAFEPNADLDASAYHAEIRGENGAWVLVDLQSRNGVFLPMRGMQRIQHQPLQNGEQVQFGPQGPRIQIEILGAPSTVMSGAPVAQGYAAGPSPAQAAPLGVPGTYAAQPQQAAQGYAGAAQAQPAMGAPPPVPPMGPPGAPPGSPAAGERPMGQATLLAHVNAMVAQQAAAAPKRGKSTVEIRAMVDQNVKKQTGSLRLVIGLLAVLVLGAAVAIVVLAIRQPEDIVALREKCNKIDPGDPARRECEKKLGALNPTDENAGRKIYDANKGAIFMLVAHKGKSFDRGGFCTAFAIKPKMLASNAHCVRASEDFEEKGADIWAHLNESNNDGKPKMLKVRKHQGHPKYKHTGMTITPDVGLFELEDDEASTTVTLADKNELKKLGAGDALYVIGFPGRTMDESSPVAVFMYSHVGRITDRYGARADSFDDSWLIQHEGQTTPGTSGSPIFNMNGKVIGINAGGLLEANKQSVYKYAMRIDLLDDVKLKGAKKSSDDDD